VKQINRQNREQNIFIRATLLAALILYVCGWSAVAARAAGTENPAATENDASCRIIYLGFVGALEPANNKYSGVVKIRETLRGKDFSDVCARSYSPYVWMDGRDWLLKHFPSHAGVLTADELQRSPKVILVGHSMGGWAMMSVARDLRSRDIPVELTIQVDSVGITDYTVPRNVKSAAIFHARDILMFMTTKQLRREDPHYTKVVANVTVDGAGHESITRDPRIRELVMKQVETLRAAFVAQAIPAMPDHPAGTSLNAAQQ
jgi:pimeloyl-ACP methyl ester carboxylesterase